MSYQAAEESVIEKMTEMHGKLSFVDGDGNGKSRIDDSFLRKYDLSRDDADIDHYEEIVNDLADKLEKMNAEKSDLQVISTALGERLQRLAKEKEDAVQAATISFEKEKRSLEAKIHDLESQLKRLVSRPKRLILFISCSFTDLCIYVANCRKRPA